jgi:hypothetical protein
LESTCDGWEDALEAEDEAEAEEEEEAGAGSEGANAEMRWAEAGAKEGVAAGEGCESTMQITSVSASSKVGDSGGNA